MTNLHFIAMCFHMHENSNMKNNQRLIVSRCITFCYNRIYVSSSREFIHILLCLQSCIGLKINFRESYKSQGFYHSTWKQACCGQVLRNHSPSLVPKHWSPFPAMALDLDITEVAPANPAGLCDGAVL